MVEHPEALHRSSRKDIGGDRIFSNGAWRATLKGSNFRL